MQKSVCIKNGTHIAMTGAMTITFLTASIQTFDLLMKIPMAMVQ